MLDLFTARPVVTQQPSIIHLIEDDDRPAPKIKVPTDRRKYLADYRDRNRETLRMQKADWYLKVGKARRKAKKKAKASA